ncbi:MAG: type II toxin-antitoxin system Phd/YefM family antitoxin [Serratia marcescens]|nr:type II toxin-antitoxin system Phd/YefM family antitoxin [Serratia marcescens]
MNDWPPAPLAPGAFLFPVGVVQIVVKYVHVQVKKMTTISYTAARNNLAEVLLEAQKQPVEVTRRGHDEVYIISKADYEVLVKAKVKARIQAKHADTIKALANR